MGQFLINRPSTEQFDRWVIRWVVAVLPPPGVVGASQSMRELAFLFLLGLCVTAGAVPGPLATPAAFVSRYHAAAASLSVPHCYYPFYAAFKL